MNTKPLFIVMSAPSGCGKSTLIDMILQEYCDIVYSISCTTRAPRGEEEDGLDYHFKTKERFEELIRGNAFIEYAKVHDNYYGTLKRETEAVLESGKNLILEIEVEGAMNVKRLCPDSAVLVMLLPPTYSVQEQRLRGRATETEEVILKRLERTKEEMEFLPYYDYVVYNYDGKAAQCAEEIRNIVRAEKSAMRRNPDVKKNFFEG